MAITSSYFDAPTSPFDDETVSQRIGKIMSPTPAEELVGPPPDSPPPHQPGQSTPLTGNLAAPPKQAVAKNRDNPASMGSYNTPSNLTGVSNPPDDGNVRSIVNPVQGVQQVQPLRSAQSPLMNPDPNASLRPGGNGAMPVLPSSATQVQAPSALDAAQSRLNMLTNTGPGVSQIKNGFARGAARVGDAALSAILPGVAPLVGGTTARNQLLIGRQQQVVGNLEQQATQETQRGDIAQQSAERAALSRKADALAQADAPQPLSKAQAALLGHPELEGEPMTQRALTTLGAATIKGNAQENTGAGHDAAKVTATGMNNATSTANAATRASSNESIAQARDKTQRLLGELRASVSTANNKRTNDTHVETAGMRSGGTGKPDETGHYKVPGDVTKKAQLASNVNENADAIEAIIQRRPELVGKLGGTISSIEKMLGSDDGDIQEIAQRAHNIALASNGAHGVRNVHDTKKTEDNILTGFRNGPNGVHGALQGLRGSVQTFLEDEKNFRQTGGRVPPANVGSSIPTGNIKVQLPDGRSGHISAGQKEQFLKDHPGAKVL